MIRSASCVVMVSVASLALAGPLAPPAGPVDETYKTLQQVEPRTPVNADTTPGDASSLYIISSPGSYYLTSNLSVSDVRNGITITDSIRGRIAGRTEEVPYTVLVGASEIRLELPGGASSKVLKIAKRPWDRYCLSVRGGRVALKVMREGLASGEARRRFRRESQLLGQLQHPGITHERRQTPNRFRSFLLGYAPVATIIPADDR